ncbi:MAG: hypothetical protein EXR63_00930 [Dehalococcoidia bacterium]|nr:hypothetical protein [Dehalococcoidia bacterium]
MTDRPGSAAAVRALLRGHESPWTLIEQTISEFWALTARPIRQALERTGTPASLRGYVDLGPGTLSPAEMRLRDPYSKPARFLEELARLAAEGWVEAIGETEYRVNARARANVVEAIRAGDAYLGTLDVLPRPDLERHADLLQRLARADAIVPEPPRQWASRRRVRVVGADMPVVAQIREHAMDLSARRDDAHDLAWMPLGAAGHVWNAFTFIWHGEARNAVEVAALQSWRGYAVDNYETAIEELVRRGWLESDATAGHYRATAAGKALRDEVEARTDLYFYQPWSVLSDGEWDELSARQATLRVRLRELRRAARDASRADA